MDLYTSNGDWFNHSETLSSFQKALILWGNSNFRSFPWRLTKNPYHILVAEIMLHRTQVVQVVPIYVNFISKYPDIESLAKASLNDLRLVLSSLGLHWRIELFYSLGQQIAERFNLQIPVDKNDLLSLPGVSDYISAAIRCFAWNIPEPLIDTNTVRVTGRVFGLETKDSSRRNSRFRNLITALVDSNNPCEYNYALLDLAHLRCFKKQPPLCQDCPIVSFCCFG